MVAVAFVVFSRHLYFPVPTLDFSGEFASFVWGSLLLGCVRLAHGDAEQRPGAAAV